MYVESVENAIKACPAMLTTNTVKDDDVYDMIDAFELYKPSFLKDAMFKMDNLSDGFVYFFKSAHDELKEYHYTWETLAWILLHNGQDEDKGGTRIYKRMKELQAENYSDKQFLKNMQVHVSDEKRHARLFMKAAEIVAKKGDMDIVDHDDPEFGENVVESLLTPVPMDLFKFIAAIYAIEFRSYIMIRNTIQHFTDAINSSDVMSDVIEIIKSIPPDESFHVEYTAKFLEHELKKQPELYDERIKQIAESLQHAGNEMITFMKEHKDNIHAEGGLASLRRIF